MVITDACTTDAGETPAIQAALRGRLRWKLLPPAQPTQARRLLSLLCRAPSAIARHPLRGRLRWKLLPPAQPRRRDACDLCFAERLRRLPGIRRGGDSGEKYHRLHNRRRRDACYPGCAVGATLVDITTACTTTQARRLLSWLRRVHPSSGTQARRLLSGLRRGGDFGGNYHRLRCLLCRA